MKCCPIRSSCSFFWHSLDLHRGKVMYVRLAGHLIRKGSKKYCVVSHKCPVHSDGLASSDFLAFLQLELHDNINMYIYYVFNYHSR